MRTIHQRDELEISITPDLLVYIKQTDSCGESQKVVFHPCDAEAVAKSLMAEVADLRKAMNAGVEGAKND